MAGSVYDEGFSLLRHVSKIHQTLKSSIFFSPFSFCMTCVEDTPKRSYCSFQLLYFIFIFLFFYDLCRRYTKALPLFLSTPLFHFIFYFFMTCVEDTPNRSYCSFQLLYFLFLFFLFLWPVSKIHQSAPTVPFNSSIFFLFFMTCVEDTPNRSYCSFQLLYFLFIFYFFMTCVEDTPNRSYCSFQLLYFFFFFYDLCRRYTKPLLLFLSTPPFSV